MADSFSRLVIGQTKASAMQILKDLGFSFRVTKEDGVAGICTRDYDPHRVNIEVQNGIVTGCHKG